MSDQSSTPTTSPLDPSLNIPAPPAGGQVTGAIPEPTPIGVPKYETLGGQYVFQGSKHDRVIRQPNGKYYVVDATGTLVHGPDGKPIEEQPALDHAQNPIKRQAMYKGPEGPPGSPTKTPSDVTSRIEPGSIAAHAAVVAGSFGVARYQEGQESSIWFGLPAEVRVQAMQAMVDRGLAPDNASSSGLDSAWVTNFKTVLAYANANNIEWTDALQSMPLVDRTKTKVVQPSHYTATLDSPQDLAAVFKDAASKLVGGGVINQSDIDGFVRAYQGMQTHDAETKAAQEEAAKYAPGVAVTVDAAGNPIPANSGDTGPPGGLPDSAVAQPGFTGQAPSPLPKPTMDVNTAVPSSGEFAKQYIKQHYPAQYGATNMANAGNLFLNSVRNLGAGPSTVGSAN